MSPYRTPVPPPIGLARRMSWWERLWLRAWRRWAVWRGPSLDQARRRFMRSSVREMVALWRATEGGRLPPPEPFRDPRPVDE